MKKIFLIASIITASISSFCQTTYPGTTLYGTMPNQDRTYRSLQLGNATIVDTTIHSADTVTLIPGFVSGAGAVFNKIYNVTVTDSTVLAIRDVSSSYTGSVMTFVITTPNASSWIKFLGYSGLSTQWLLAGGTTKFSLTANHYFTITMYCTGTAWIELYHAQD